MFNEILVDKKWLKSSGQGVYN